MKNRKKECFRNEWKYLISTSEKELLKLRMKHFLKLDPHAGTGSYMIRSLYFDDYWNSAFEEKEAGVLMRKKYRIRAPETSAPETSAPETSAPTQDPSGDMDDNVLPDPGQDVTVIQ